MNVILWLIACVVSGTTLSPLEEIFGAELVESVFHSESSVLAELLESGRVETAIDYATNIVRNDPSKLSHRDVLKIIMVAKASVDNLRIECQQLSKRFPKHHRGVSVEKTCAMLERDSNERAIQILGMSLIPLLRLLIDDATNRSDADRAQYYLTIGDFLRYAIGAGKRGRAVHEAFSAYERVVDIDPRSILALTSLNHQALLVREVHGEVAAIHFMEDAILSANSVFIEYISSRNFSAGTALEMKEIMDMMKHNLALWTEANEWVIV